MEAPTDIVVVVYLFVQDDRVPLSLPSANLRSLVITATRKDTTSRNYLIVLNLLRASGELILAI